MFRVMKDGCYVTVDDGGNYAIFHELNVRVKIKLVIVLTTSAPALDMTFFMQ